MRFIANILKREAQSEKQTKGTTNKTRKVDN